IVRWGRAKVLPPPKKNSRRRVQHLPQLFASPAGQTARRMAEFLDLRGEGASAAFLDARDEPAADPPDHGEKKPVPLDGRVVLRFLPVQQIAVLDEQQASGDEVRYRSKITVDPFRELGGIDLVAGAIGNPDAGLVLLG